MNILTVLLALSVPTATVCKQNCDTISRPLKYYRIQKCKKSTLPIVFWSDVSSLRECLSFAEKKKGLAFNYSPREGIEFINGSLRNCQIMGCPEMGRSETLVSDMAFDYYSSFGYLNSSSNITCIKNIGVFGVFPAKRNYTNAFKSCKLFGGVLADVSIEVRTKYLSEFLNTTLENWYKVAYVGMDDMKKEGKFVTASGSPLSCSNYRIFRRAWAPGHPRSMSENEDCVVLDSDKLWRVVNCTTRLPSVCELFPGKPIRSSFFQKDCKQIKDNNSTRPFCEEEQSVHELLKNSTRSEICSMLNNNTLSILD